METEDHSNKSPASPKKRRQWSLAIAPGLVAFFFVVVWLALTAPPDPVYQGKHLSAWLAQYDTTSLKWPRDPLPADEAVRHIGTNAFPMIVRRLRASDSKAKINLILFLQRTLHTYRLPIPTAIPGHIEALQALGALGNDAEPLVPELADAIDHGRVWPDGYAGFWLQSLGSDGEAAVPALARRLQDTNITVRFWDLITLAHIGIKQTNVVLPLLEASLTDADPIVRM